MTNLKERRAQTTVDNQRKASPGGYITTSTGSSPCYLQVTFKTLNVGHFGGASHAAPNAAPHGRRGHTDGSSVLAHHDVDSNTPSSRPLQIEAGRSRPKLGVPARTTGRYARQSTSTGTEMAIASHLGIQCSQPKLDRLRFDCPGDLIQIRRLAQVYSPHINFPDAQH